VYHHPDLETSTMKETIFKPSHHHTSKIIKTQLNQTSTANVVTLSIDSYIYKKKKKQTFDQPNNIQVEISKPN